MMLFQLATKNQPILFEAPKPIVSKPSGEKPELKSPVLQTAMTEVHNGAVEFGKVYSYQLSFDGTPATLKLDFTKTQDGIVVGTQYDLGKLGKTERGASDALSKNWSLSGQFSLNTTTYDTYKITVTDPKAGAVKIELNSSITTGVKEPLLLGMEMVALNSADFKGDVKVTLPLGGAVKIDMVNIIGRSACSVMENLPPGTSDVHLTFPTGKLAAGTYFLTLSAEGAAPVIAQVKVQ